MDLPTWWPAVAAAVPGIATWVYTLYKARLDRLDNKDSRRLTYEEKQEQNLMQERERVSAELQVILKDLRAEVERYRSLANEKNRERYQALELAHFWHGMTWDYRNEVAQTRQLLESTCRLANLPPPIWTKSLDLPNFDNTVWPAKSDKGP